MNTYLISTMSTMLLTSTVLAKSPLPEHLQNNENMATPVLAPTYPISKRHQEFSHQKQLQNMMSTTQMDAECSAFIGLSGSSLISEIVKSTPKCVGLLFKLKNGNATTIFSESNIRYAAAAFRDRAKTYTGTDTSGVESLVLFIRGALYVQHYNPELVPEYSSAVKTDINTALTNFFNNNRAWTVSEANGSVLQEALVLIDSLGVGAKFNYVTLKVLSEYDAQWKASFSMSSAANAIFTTLFRAQQNDEMNALFESDHRILEALYQFQLNNRDMIGTQREYLLTNSVSEMSRLFYIESMRSKLSHYVKEVLKSTDRNGESHSLWLAAAARADNYDKANCNEYGICGFKPQLEKDTLQLNWKCSDSLRIKAQNLYVDQATWACSVLSDQEQFFHEKLSTNLIPVEEDNNEALELIIFDSPNDYRTYASILFDIRTDNGGMYLEGSPSSKKNQARFIAYEADWKRPDFHIWNLQHEYVHYLDGRYNLFGDFRRATSVNTTWWAEGLGEYISYQDANTTAIEMGKTQQYKLSEIFNNNYDSGQDRIYRWGYLAVRFMFEKHKVDIDHILNLFRQNRYTEYQAFMDNIADRYESEWQAWLISDLSTKNDGIKENGPTDEIAIDSGSQSNWEGPNNKLSEDYSTCVVTNEQYRHNPDATSLEIDQPIECISAKDGRASFAFGNTERTSNDLWIKSSGGWGDADVFFGSEGWASGETNEGAGIEYGNDEIIKVSFNPEKLWHYLTLSGDFGGVDLIVSETELFPDDSGPAPVTNCGDVTLEQGELALNKVECIAGGRVPLYFWVDKDNTEVSISTHGGEGNADLYYNATRWASSTDADSRSESLGNNEYIKVTAFRGWNYVTIDSDSSYSGVSIKLTTAVPKTPDGTPPCGVATVNYGQVFLNKKECVSGGNTTLYFEVDEDNTQVSMKISGGDGNANIYYKSDGWATPTDAELRSENIDNNDVITTKADKGWHYVTIDTPDQYSGVTLEITSQ
ncbi:M9 family metallopeptidase [Pseudoalteromonas aliena]|uniref:M9 family metallopeptidase n=1 Tax=Pseudoalteromonas aliena TaxID=247523 RepID=UPI0024952A1C|nr:M9 family metallopeptidase [Pseudoalteromonas aliena]